MIQDIKVLPSSAAPGVHLYPDSATNRMTYELENKWYAHVVNIRRSK